MLFILGFILGVLIIWYWMVLARDRFPMAFYEIKNNAIIKKDK